MPIDESGDASGAIVLPGTYCGLCHRLDHGSVACDAVSPLMTRLIEEVRNDIVNGINAYDRFHRRHNRSMPRPRPRPTEDEEDG